MGKGENDQATTVTKAEPWKPVQPYLEGAMRDANSLYARGAPQYYPNQQVAPMSSYTRNSYDAMAQRAMAGSPVTNAAQQHLTNTLGGGYLSAGNPYFQGAVNAATRPMVNAFNDQVMPGLDSNFSSAGRYGSGAHALASSDAGAQLQQQIGDVSSQMAYQNYGDERQRQVQAMMFAPDMAAQDYKDILALQSAGQGYDQYNQNLINADMQKYDYNMNAPYNWLANYVGILGGVPGPSSTQTATTPRPSTMEQVGGALLGTAGTAASIFAGGGLSAAPYNPMMVGTFY